MKTITFESLIDSFEDSNKIDMEFFLDGQHVIEWTHTNHSLTIKARGRGNILYSGDSIYRFMKKNNENIPVDGEGNLLMKWELDNGRSIEIIEKTLIMYRQQRFG